MELQFVGGDNIPRFIIGKRYSFSKRVNQICDCAEAAISNGIYFRFCTYNGTIVSTKRDQVSIIRVMLDNGPFEYDASWVIEDGYYPEFDEDDNYTGFVEDDEHFYQYQAPRGTGY